MKTIGIIGGMSWESTAKYYELINREIAFSLGSSHSARCIVYSFDLQEIKELQYSGAWDELRSRLFEVGRGLKAAGADFIVLCTNTLHKVMDGFEEEVGIPFLHIVDLVGEAARADGIETVGLLGTKFTMEGDFYKGKLERDYGLKVIVPNEADRMEVNRVIYEELVRGVVSEESRWIYVHVMDSLAHAGCRGIILGCTEIGMLVKAHSTRLYNTTVLHVRKAARLAMERD
jgi:aspartate racemase